jgi:hypothetical protein
MVAYGIDDRQPGDVAALLPRYNSRIQLDGSGAWQVAAIPAQVIHDARISGSSHDPVQP